MSKAGKVRRLAAQVSEKAEVAVGASWEAPHWRLQWSDGPTYPRLRTLLEACDTGGIDITTLRMDRIVQDGAVLVQAVRLALSGELPCGPGPQMAGQAHSAAEYAAEYADYPERAQGREAALTQALLAATPPAPHGRPSTAAAIALLAEHGTGWLLTLAPSHDPERAALELLTASYATGQDAQDWKRSGSIMTAKAAVEVVLADPHASPAARLAALSLTRAARAQLLAECDTAELALIDAAKDSGASWTQIGRALGGITKQSASERAGNLRRGRTRGAAGIRQKGAAALLLVRVLAGFRLVVVLVAAVEVPVEGGAADAEHRCHVVD